MATSIRAGFYRHIGKRWFDAVSSFVGLVALAPLLAICGVLVKCSSPGPILFVQERVGQGGRIFRIWKFRSMFVGAEQAGPGVTVAGDSRLTRVGAVLRGLKIDELPQLWNVLVGEMSLVGPRPELRHYAERYTPEQQRVLTVRPGVTGPASLKYRNKEEVLGQSPEPEKFYRKVVLPDKLALDLAYIEKMSFSYDLYLIARTLVSIFVSSPAGGEREK